MEKIGYENSTVRALSDMIENRKKMLDATQKEIDYFLQLKKRNIINRKIMSLLHNKMEMEGDIASLQKAINDIQNRSISRDIVKFNGGSPDLEQSIYYYLRDRKEKSAYLHFMLGLYDKKLNRGEPLSENEIYHLKLFTNLYFEITYLDKLKNIDIEINNAKELEEYVSRKFTDILSL